MRKKFYIVTLTVLFSSSCFGITFRKYDMSTGLCNNSVICVNQTNDGLVWIGTRDGLCRFNGNTYTVFKQNFDDKNSISNNSINCLFEASNGDLWIGTTMGLNRYSKESELFQKYFILADGKGLSHNYIRAITETANGKILIGSPFGIDIFDPATNSFRKIPISKKKDGKANSVLCFFKDSKDRILVGLRSGLYLYSNEILENISIRESSGENIDECEIRDIKEDINGTIWLATEERGVLSLKIHSKIAELSNHYSVENSKIISNHVRKLYFYKKEMWLGTMEGLSILNQNDQTFSNYQYAYNSPEGISNNSVRDIFGDKQGGIWLATYAGGINYYHQQNNLFPHYKMRPEEDNLLTSNVISGILEEESKNLWIATDGGGLVLQKSSDTKSTHYLFRENANSLVHNNIKTITHDRKGNLWIGTYNGLSYLNVQTNRFTNYQNHPGVSNTLLNNQVHSVAVDDDDLLWIGMNGGGIQTFNQVTQIFKSVTTIEVKNVNVLIAGRNNRLWIGHQGGLGCIDRSSMKKIDLDSYFKQLPLSVQYVQSLFEDHLGRIWIGTQGFGLFLISEDKMFWFNVDKGLPDNTINAIVEDGQGHFWISTNKGISKLIFSLSDGKSPEFTVKTYTKGQGLQEFQYVPMSVFKTRAGEIYFGGVNGYNKFNPIDIQNMDFFPTLILTDLGVRSENKEGIIHWPLPKIQDERKEIRLNYRDRDISVEFWGINYIDPNNTFYRYRLINVNSDWINMGTQHTINFNYLPSGKFELQLQASTNPEKWDTRYESLEITILPPWWYTAWAFIGYFILLMLLLTIFFILSKRWASLNHQLAMEHFQREKEDELNQAKLKFFTDVSHELRTPLTLIVAPLEQIIKQPDLNSRLRNQLSLIQLNGNRMMRLINRVLDLRRLDSGCDKLQVAQGDIVKFLKETSLAFKGTANIKSIDFEFVTELQSLEIWFDRDKMEMILYNLLSNAIKNTSDFGRITLTLTTENAGIIPGMKSHTSGNKICATIRVTDNGRGIPTELLDRIFERFFVSGLRDSKFASNSGIGLELTKRLVELHKGHISVESQEKTDIQEGHTCVSVYLPLGKDHLVEQEISVGFRNSEDSGLYSTSKSIDEVMEDFSWIPEEEVQTEKKEYPEEKIRLLIVEDNSEVRNFIKSLFIGQYIVDVAENGITGLGKATKHVPDLIICDIMMPEMDGMELCKRIKTDIRTSHIPVILLTARTAITFKYEGLEIGADDYITKPFSADFLRLRVRNLIGQRAALRNHFTREMICDPAKITVTSVDEKLLKKAVDYIGSHMSDSSLSVESLSHELGLSRVHLYRKIKAITNLTAVEFIRSIRLKRAASLLQENKLNINEISAIVGVDDVDYFRSCFKHQFGTSPSEYSRQNRNDS